MTGLYDYRDFFVNEQACWDLVRRIRWPDGIKCPQCQCYTIYAYIEAGLQHYECKRCAHKFSDMSGTFLARTRTPLSKWMLAIGLCKIGISAHQLHTEIGVTYKTAYRMLKQIRAAMRTAGFGQVLSGEVEVDEAYFGGRQKGMVGRHPQVKVSVVGLKSRMGQVKSIVVPRVNSLFLWNVIKGHVAKKSTLYTDAHQGYRGVGMLGYTHHIVDHSKQYVVDGTTHTQGIEGYWSYAKRLLRGTYIRPSKQKMQMYMDESDFKFNMRHHPDFLQAVLTTLLSLSP